MAKKNRQPNTVLVILAILAIWFLLNGPFGLNAIVTLVMSDGEPDFEQKLKFDKANPVDIRIELSDNYELAIFDNSQLRFNGISQSQPIPQLNLWQSFAICKNSPSSCAYYDKYKDGSFYDRLRCRGNDNIRYIGDQYSSCCMSLGYEQVIWLDGDHVCGYIKWHHLNITQVKVAGTIVNFSETSPGTFITQELDQILNEFCDPPNDTDNPPFCRVRIDIYNELNNRAWASYWFDNEQITDYECIKNEDCSLEGVCVSNQCEYENVYSKTIGLPIGGTITVNPGETFEQEFSLYVEEIRPNTESEMGFEVEGVQKFSISTPESIANYYIFAMVKE